MTQPLIYLRFLYGDHFNLKCFHIAFYKESFVLYFSLGWLTFAILCMIVNNVKWETVWQSILGICASECCYLEGTYSTKEVENQWKAPRNGETTHWFQHSNMNPIYNCYWEFCDWKARIQADLSTYFFLENTEYVYYRYRPPIPYRQSADAQSIFEG